MGRRNKRRAQSQNKRERRQRKKEAAELRQAAAEKKASQRLEAKKDVTPPKPVEADPPKQEALESQAEASKTSTTKNSERLEKVQKGSKSKTKARYLKEDKKEPLLSVRGLRTRFHTDAGYANAVNGVDFDVHSGETLALVGESGSGKSVCSLSIMRLIPNPPGEIHEGSIKFKGQELLDLDWEEMRKIRGKEIAMIFQEPMTSLNPVYTIGEQVTEPLLFHSSVSNDGPYPFANDLISKLRTLLTILLTLVFSLVALAAASGVFWLASYVGVRVAAAALGSFDKDGLPPASWQPIAGLVLFGGCALFLWRMKKLRESLLSELADTVLAAAELFTSLIMWIPVGITRGLFNPWISGILTALLAASMAMAWRGDMGVAVLKVLFVLFLMPPSFLFAKRMVRDHVPDLHEWITHERAQREAFERGVQLLDEVGIPDPERRMADYPHQFSGGMRQRAMIAQALANGPALLIADEPTTALDVTIQAQILELMKKVKEKRKDSAIILITHDLAVVAETCDRVIVLYGGIVQEVAPVGKLFKTPRHPYTSGLLASLPAPKEGEKPPHLATIRGMVPNIHSFPKGCKFSNRCDLVEDRCHDIEPDLMRIRKDHWVRCHLVEEEMVV